MPEPTFYMSEDLIEEIDSRLEYGDSRSEFVRNAIELQLAVLDEIDDDLTEEERRELVVEAIRQADSA